MTSVAPYDEQQIDNDDTIIRRISAEYIVPDANTGGERLSSKAFSASSGENGGMSVDLLPLMIEAGEDAEEFVTTPVFTGSVQFPAGAARKAGLWVGYEPLPDNAYHGEVWRSPAGGRFTGGQTKALMNASNWFVEIPSVEIPKK